MDNSEKNIAETKTLAIISHTQALFDISAGKTKFSKLHFIFSLLQHELHNNSN